MTFDDKPDPDDLDELASAVVDDEASEAERAQVAADPRLTARAQVFREIADRVGQVPPADEDTRSATLTAVLAAGATASAPPTSDDRRDAAVTGTVVPLAARSRSWRHAPAVAAVVVVLLAVPAVLIAVNRSSGGSKVALSSSDTATPSSVSEAASNPPAGAATTSTSVAASGGSSGTPPTTDSATVADLGSLASTTELSASVKEQLTQRPATTGSASGSSIPTTSTPTTVTPIPTHAPATTTTPTPLATTDVSSVDCEAAIRSAVPGLGQLLLRAKATYQGAPAQVYGFQDPASNGTTAIVTEPSTCTVLARAAA